MEETFIYVKSRSDCEEGNSQNDEGASSKWECEFRVLLAAELIEKVYEKLNSKEPNESVKGRIQESGDNTDNAWIGYEESQLW